jgi:hypothetical protein
MGAEELLVVMIEKVVPLKRVEIYAEFAGTPVHNVPPELVNLTAPSTKSKTSEPWPENIALLRITILGSFFPDIGYAALMLFCGPSRSDLNG